MPAGKGRYTIGGKGTHGCSGYPVVGGEGKVHGCHETRAQAQAQQAAIYTSEAQKGIDSEDFYKAWSVQENNPECDGFAVVGDSGTVYGCFKTREEASAAVTAHNNDEANDDMDDDDDDDDIWRGSAFESMTKKSPCWDGYVQRGMKEKNGKMVPNCVPVQKCCPDSDFEKADSYTPNDGMKAAARRALKWKEEGKATGAGTPVGWGRASDIVAGRSMSLDTVKRMYSFFSRHEVDKKGRGFYDGPEFPSNGRIMWDAWGGDAGFSWSKSIVEREAEKMWEGSAFDTSFAKRDYSTSERRRLAAAGAAMPDGSFPIANRQDLQNAIQSVGRASNYESAKRHIIRRARALGLTNMLPEEWMNG